MKTSMRTLGVACLLVVLGGCASLDPRSGYQATRQAVQQRTGVEPYWKVGGPADAQVEAAVRQLLKQPLSVEHAVRVALVTSPRMQATWESLGIAQAELVQAGLLRNPVLDAVVQYPRDGGDPLLDLGLSIDFMHILTRPLRRAVGEAAYEKTRLQVIATAVDLARDVRLAWYQAQADEQLVDMMRQVVKATEASWYASQRLRKAGNITQLALDREAALHQASRLQLASAEAALLASREHLSVLMGLWGTAINWVLPDRLPSPAEQPPDYTDLEKRAIEANLDLAMMRQEMEGLARRLGLTRVERILPDLEVGYTWEREAVTREWKDGPLLAFEIPVLDTGAARMAGLAARLRQLQREYVARAIEIRSAARMARASLDNSRAVVRHYEKVLLPLRQRITHGTQLEYNAMLTGVFQLLNAKQQEIATGQQYIQALRNYWQARTRYDTLLNGRSSDMTGGMVSIDTGAAAGGDSGGH